MEFRVVVGKYKKFFVYIDDIKTKEDFELYELVKSILYRKEYKPFIQSFNKNIEATYLFRNYYFPIQFWYDVKTKLTDAGYDFNLIDEHLLGMNQLDLDDYQIFLDELNKTLPDKYKFPDDIENDKYSYQRESVKRILQNKIGIIEIGTSGGKTFITYLFCKYIQRLGNKNNKQNRILIIVPSKLLAQQLKNDFDEYQQNIPINTNNRLVVESIFTGSKRIINADVVCGTYQSLCEYDEEYFDDFMGIVCDELHTAKAYSIRNKIYNKIKNGEYFFGMTGTKPKYNTLDYLHITSMFGNSVFTKTISELIEDGISVPVKIHVINIKYQKHNDLAKKLKEQGIIGMEKFNAEKTFLQEYEPRTNLIYKLLKAIPTNSLILVSTVEYCYVLQEYLKKKFEADNLVKDIDVVNGKISNRENIINRMKTTQKDFILIGTKKTMSTGVSIPNIENIYFVDGGKSENETRQSIGRGLRLSLPTGKAHCNLFDFHDNIPGLAFNNHAKERKNIYKEQGLKYKITDVTI